MADAFVLREDAAIVTGVALPSLAAAQMAAMAALLRLVPGAGTKTVVARLRAYSAGIEPIEDGGHYISRVAVAPECRGRGLGGRIVGGICPPARAGEGASARAPRQRAGDRALPVAGLCAPQRGGLRLSGGSRGCREAGCRRARQLGESRVAWNHKQGCHGPRMRATQVTTCLHAEEAAPSKSASVCRTHLGWPAFAGHDSLGGPTNEKGGSCDPPFALSGVSPIYQPPGR